MAGFEYLHIYMNRQTGAHVLARRNPYPFGLPLTLIYDGRKLGHYVLRAGQWEIFDDAAPKHEMMADMPFHLKYVATDPCDIRDLEKNR